jgi:hypothetical protein
VYERLLFAGPIEIFSELFIALMAVSPLQEESKMMEKVLKMP